MKRLLFMAVAVVLLAMGILTGCSKDEILSTYNHAIQAAGDAQLTGKWSLEGKRKYGVDHYTGTYTADYENFQEQSISLEELPLTVKREMKLRLPVS